MKVIKPDGFWTKNMITCEQCLKTEKAVIGFEQEDAPWLVRVCRECLVTALRMIDKEV